MKIQFLIGSFIFATTKASCSEGYSMEIIDKGYQCVDIDECEDKTHDCDLDAYFECENTIGSFTCECFPGKRFYILQKIEIRILTKANIIIL